MANLIKPQSAVLEAFSTQTSGDLLQIEHSPDEILGSPAAGNGGKLLFLPNPRRFVDESLSMLVGQLGAGPEKNGGIKY